MKNNPILFFTSQCVQHRLPRKPVWEPREKVSKSDHKTPNAINHRLSASVSAILSSSWKMIVRESGDLRIVNMYLWKWEYPENSYCFTIFKNNCLVWKRFYVCLVYNWWKVKLCLQFTIRIVSFQFIFVMNTFSVVSLLCYIKKSMDSKVIQEDELCCSLSLLPELNFIATSNN